jgi:hypothetical protein
MLAKSGAVRAKLGQLAAEHVEIALERVPLLARLRLAAARRRRGLRAVGGVLVLHVLIASLYGG